MTPRTARTLRLDVTDTHRLRELARQSGYSQNELVCQLIRSAELQRVVRHALIVTDSQEGRETTTG